MRVAILSGKGGAGKTFVSVNMASSIENSLYVDCDVEEPNGEIFLKPEKKEEKDVCVKLPEFDTEKCNGCRKCIDFCRFNALVYIKRPKVFSEVCHSCGGCMIVCPEEAISERDREIGKVRYGTHKDVGVITGVLNTGESSGVAVINNALETAYAMDRENIIIDCPPGSACSVMESVADSDYAIIVAEPTAFGFDNFKMVYRLVNLLGKRCGVVINKMDEEYEPLESYCRKNRIPVLLRLSYDENVSKMLANGELVAEKSKEYREKFRGVWRKIGGIKS